MDFYLITKKSGEVVASTIVGDFATDDPNLSNKEIAEYRLQDSIDDGVLNDEQYQLNHCNELFKNEADYKAFVMEMKERWKGGFVEI